MDYKRIDDNISQVILTDLSYFDDKKFKEYSKMDKMDGMILSVMIDNLSYSDQKIRCNYQNFIGGREFFHKQYGFRAYPPFTYLSQNIHFVKSTLNQYDQKNYDLYIKLKDMNLEQYLSYLEKIYIQTDLGRRKELMKDYLLEYISKYPNREKYHLFSIGHKNEFIAKGMYLYGILPTMFVKIG
jgi:hypothetical protein